MIYKYFLVSSWHSSAIALLTFFLVASTGCASKQPVYQDVSAVVASSKAKGTLTQEKGWWQAAIRIKPVKEAAEEKANDPMWQVDLFLAHSVMAPILEKYHEDIILWRFHRRATHDAVGHQFSFIFYSSPQIAKYVFEEIASSTLLEKAKERGFIISEKYDDTTILTRPAISDTSDGNWSTITQKAWPHYIMGVSQMWLTMIDDIIKDNPPPAEDIQSINDLIDYYNEVNEVVKTLWRDEAQHAFLHHLNAVFGYEPMLYYEPRLMRF
jgi:hypothetical protein